jgi:CubicO group peptidase (beta-lactamase class C family)
MPDTSPLPQATPESVGLSIRQLLQAMDVLHAEVEDGHIGGAVFGIARHGKLAWLEAVGYRDRDAGDAMRTDAIFPLASMTKPIVSVAAMMLVERGKLLLADPVSRYLPQFADMQIAVETRDSRTGTARTVLQPASSEITVQDLLRHTAGMVNANLLPRTSVRQRYLDAGVTSTDQSLAERDGVGIQHGGRRDRAVDRNRLWHAARPLCRGKHHRAAADGRHRLSRAGAALAPHRAAGHRS